MYLAAFVIELSDKIILQLLQHYNAPLYIGFVRIELRKPWTIENRNLFFIVILEPPIFGNICTIWILGKVHKNEKRSVYYPKTQCSHIYRKLVMRRGSVIYMYILRWPFYLRQSIAPRGKSLRKKTVRDFFDFYDYNTNMIYFLIFSWFCLVGYLFFYFFFQIRCTWFSRVIYPSRIALC